MKNILKNLIVGVGLLGLFTLTANAQWVRVSKETDVFAFAVSGSNIFAGTQGFGVYLSTNNGTSWTAVDSGIPANTNVNALAVSGGNIFAGTTDGVYLSTNNGTSWTAVNSGLPRWHFHCHFSCRERQQYLCGD